MLGREIEENVAAQERTNAKAAEIFAFFDEVSCSAPSLFVGAVVLISCGHGCYSLCTFTGLCEMEGAPRGGYASVDTVDRRDSELRSPLNRPAWGACSNGCILRVWLSIHIYRVGYW